MNDILEKVLIAKKKFGDFIHETPLEYNTTFSKISNNDVYLKLENLQKTGSFKIRGALNKINSLNQKEKKSGVITASAGNHGQGVALAATINNIASTVVLPEGTAIIKIEAIENYGANVIIHGKNYDEAYQHARKIQEEKGLIFVHAFNDPEIIIGQGTIGFEIMEQLPETDVIVVPIGGGGLISGIGSYCKAFKPGIRIIGAESKGSPSMYQSIKKNKIIELKEIDTIADGIAIKKPGDITFSIIKEIVDEILLVDDDEVANAILMLMERAKIVTEGAGAVSLAATLDKLDVKNKKVVVVISGGNIDMTLINRIIVKGLIKAGRLLKFTTKLVDKPGSLMKVLKILADQQANIISITHNREMLNVPLKQTIVQIDLETRNKKHMETIKDALNKKGYEIKIIEP
ncbi:MAG: threonine ammonia-lyase [Candidatus Lokiarchaeota archaeon]|nr:threonine ammonia-lyase [Candidatus Lokiarchaeota archaeon]